MIRAIGYEPATQQMEVEFHDGGIYRYHHVPADKHSALLKAESIGNHFNEHFRGRPEHKE